MHGAGLERGPNWHAFYHVTRDGMQDIGCEAELILATLMESQQTEPLSQQPQPPAEGHLGPAPGSAVPGDTPWNARGSHPLAIC